MTAATIGSIGSHPTVARITAAAITPTDPAASAMASMYAPSTARLARAPERSSANTTRFTTSPRIATTSIGPASTSKSPLINRSAASIST